MALNAMSPPWKSITDAICAQLASRLRWLSTTPFGAPSEPLVNSTTAGASGSVEAPGRPLARHASRLARSFARILQPDETHLLRHALHHPGEPPLLHETAARDHRAHASSTAGRQHRRR